MTCYAMGQPFGVKLSVRSCVQYSNILECRIGRKWTAKNNSGRWINVLKIHETQMSTLIRPYWWDGNGMPMYICTCGTHIHNTHTHTHTHTHTDICIYMNHDSKDWLMS